VHHEAAPGLVPTATQPEERVMGSTQQWQAIFYLAAVCLLIASYRLRTGPAAWACFVLAFALPTIIAGLR